MSEPAVNINQEIESKALALPDQARMIVVTDNESMERANTFKLDIKAMIKEVDDWFKPLTEKAFAAHRALTQKQAETKKPLLEADAYITDQVKVYLRKVREEEEREAARLREIARKEEEERRLREAEELEADGNIDEAAALLDEPMTYVAPAPVKMETPRVDNRMYRTQIKVRVKDRPTFLKSVPPGTLIDCLNEQAWSTIESGLARKAKNLGRAFSMPGCELYEA